MTRIYLDLETYRPNENGAFIDERIIAAGLIIDKTPFHTDSIKENIFPLIFSEWKGHNEKTIVELILLHLNKILCDSRFTVVCGYNILQYDIPLLVSRSVELLEIDPKTAARQWWEPFTIDLQQQVLTISTGRFKGTSLGNVVQVAKKYGLSPPDYTVSGAGVCELYSKHEYEDIERHLVQDLRIVRWLHLKGLYELAVKGVGLRGFFE